MKSLFQIIVVIFLALFVVGCSDSNERKIPKVEKKVLPAASKEASKKKSKQNNNTDQKIKELHADKMLNGAGIDMDMSMSEIMERSKNIKEDAVAF